MTAPAPFDTHDKTEAELIQKIRSLELVCGEQDASAQKAHAVIFSQGLVAKRLREALEEILKETQGVIHAPVHTLKNVMGMIEVALDSAALKKEDGERQAEALKALRNVVDSVDNDNAWEHAPYCFEPCADPTTGNMVKECKCGIDQIQDALQACREAGLE